MALIKWNDNLSVKVAEIDTQHKKLVELINDLHQAMIDRKTKEVLEKIINGLIDYTQTHFSTEEKFFDKFGYPETASHKEEHKDFVNKVVDFQNGFNNGKLMVSIEIINFLKNWLINHIQGTDKNYSNFFNEKGLK